MSEVAIAYRSTTMMSEEPSMDWIVRGVVGVRTYLGHAVLALRGGDIAGKLEAVQKASNLLQFLQQIIVKDEGDEEGRKLAAQISDSYSAIQFSIAVANAKSDVAAFQEARRRLQNLATYLGKLSGGSA